MAHGYAGIAQMGGKSAAELAEAANKGDTEALAVLEKSAAYLGRGLAVLIDVLNPEAIVIGSIYTRNVSIFKAPMEAAIQKEALGESAAACRILPAALGEHIGDYAALCTALSGEQDFYKTYPECLGIKNEIEKAIRVIAEAYRNGGKVLICGNGGSSSDSAHIVGEFLKGFKKKRPLPEALRQSLGEMGEKLQCSLPAIDLTAQAGIISAVANDLGGEYVYAQQILGLGKAGDILLAISTSGNAKNVYNACLAAKTLGLSVIGMTGSTGGKMKELCDILIAVPETETADVQELHLPIYHHICASVEALFFEK